MLAIAHWPHPGRINSSSPTFRRRYVRRINGFSFRLLIFAVLDYILTSSLNSGLDTVSLTVLLPFQYLVFHIITLYFHSSLHYSNILWPFGLLLVVINSCCVSLILIFSILNIQFSFILYILFMIIHMFLYCILNSNLWCRRFLVNLSNFLRFVRRQIW